MIPTMMVLGLVLGRWWHLALATAAVGWPLLLLAGGVVEPGVALLGAALLAVANAGVGVLLHQAVLQGYRRLRRDRSRALP